MKTSFAYHPFVWIQFWYMDRRQPLIQFQYIVYWIKRLHNSKYCVNIMRLNPCSLDTTIIIKLYFRIHSSSMKAPFACHNIFFWIQFSYMDTATRRQWVQFWSMYNIKHEHSWFQNTVWKVTLPPCSSGMIAIQLSSTKVCWGCIWNTSRIYFFWALVITNYNLFNDIHNIPGTCTYFPTLAK